MAIAVSPDGNLVVSGSYTGSITVWKLHGNTESQNFPTHHTSWINSLDFSPNGLYIASGSGDKTVCLWDTSTGSLIRQFEQFDNRVTSAKFSPDSQKLVVCSKGALSVWDVGTGTMLSGPWGQDSFPVSATYSSNGCMVVSGAGDGTVHVWDAKDGTELTAPFRGHTDWARSVAFTPDNRRVVSGSDDGNIRFWDLGHIHDIQKPMAGHWKTHDDGWIKDSESRLVLWLPPDLQRITPISPCSLVISSKGLVQADFSSFVYGDHWQDCYSEPSGSDMPDI